MSAYELCGYAENYAGTYYPASKAVANEFGLTWNRNPSWCNNYATKYSLTPLECPDDKKCEDGICSWKTVKDQWNTKDHCTEQACCVPIVRCTNMELEVGKLLPNHTTLTYLLS